MPRLAVFLPCLFPLLFAACGEVEDTRPGQPVKTRQQAFKEMIKVFEPMGVMLREGRYEPEKFLRLASALHETREAPWTHFAADTNYPPTKATAQVWEDEAGFVREKEKFLAATDKLLAAAKAQDETQSKTAYEAVYASCQDCHKPFKKR
ncbi:c-type cytochrome [Azonexus sp.]|uniref:c-type cytochrome n=1 Tax=Azonexus sp. TaxID=1872668 RepID=UPI0039E26530